MRQFLTIALVALFSAAGAQQKLTDQFVLKGRIAGQDGVWMFLSYTNKDAKYVRDSVQVKNGTFQFKGAINEPVTGFLRGKTTSRGDDDPNATVVFLEPANMTIAVENRKFKEAVVTGSNSNADYVLFESQFNKLRKRWKPVMDSLSAINKRSNTQYQELKEWVLAPYFAEYDEIEYAFFTAHPGSFITAFQLRFILNDLTTDSLKLFYNRFPEKVKQSSFGKLIMTAIEKRKVGVPGAVAANFNTVDINGNKFSLADYKGKYVLLDFWASWCVPCRKGNPHLKELYAKYNAKGFEVIGVSDDDRDNAAWKKAVAQDALPWKHVLRGLKEVNGTFDRSHDISDLFNISTLPTQILIDPSGKIIGRYGSGGEDHAMLDGKLESLIK